MSPHTRIFLAGFMASGKSTIGPLLAEWLGFDFLDLDSVIEEREGRPIPELFSERGERGFREAETRALADLTESLTKGVVVALGGGAFLSPENRRLIKKGGLSVWLDVPVEELATRVLRSSRTRPILERDGRRLSGGELEAEIRRLLEGRRSAYVLADLHLEVEADSTVESNAEALLARLREHAP